MSVVVVATIVPVDEHRAEVITAIEHSIERAHAEDAGCELYALHEGKDRLIMIEKWASIDDLKAHGAGPALTELTAALDGKLVSPMDVQVVRPHPAGTETQGTV